MCVVLFFFFKQKTAYEMRISDWSSDVCSSDLYLWSLALTSWSAWRVVPLQEATNPMVNGQPARPNGDQRDRYRRPGQVKIRPPVWNDDMDDRRHAEKAQGAQTRRQTEHQPHRQDNHGRAIYERARAQDGQVLD